jgi:outer membrane protein assembly factor BamE (lipoprotein component of BamABCDE complex)
MKVLSLKRRANLKYILIILAMAISACSTFSKSSENNLYRVHIGDTQAQMIEELGTPSKQIKDAEGEKWLYEIYSTDNREIYPYTAVFHNGVLAQWNFDTSRKAEDIHHTETSRTPSSRY